jgi:hypothetical protein
MEGKIKWIFSKYDGMARTKFMRHRMRATGTFEHGTEAMVSIKYRNICE